MIGPPAPLSTPEKRGAFEQLKGFVRGVIDAHEIDAHAFRLTGESQATIDREARELFEILLQQRPPLPRSTALGLAFTFHRLLSERIREIVIQTGISLEIAQETTGISQVQVSRWAKRLKDRDAYRVKLFGKAYATAMAKGCV